MPYRLTTAPYLVVIVLLLSTLIFASESEALDIRVSDSRDNNFYMDALTWVLDKSGLSYHLIHTKHPTSTQKRKVALVLNGEIDVIYAGTTQRLEDTLHPVRFPITRGLVGTRVLLINRRYQSDFRQINSLQQLQRHIAALGYEWPETEIFSAAGLRYTEKVYDDIFIMLNRGGRYYFPRGAMEAFSELKNKRHTLPNLMVDDSLLLQYKSAVLFFVHPQNTALKTALELGFNKGYQDGSYNRFFYNHPLIRTSFDTAKLGDRTVIEIPNQQLPAKSAAIAAKYWHRGKQGLVSEQIP